MMDDSIAKMIIRLQEKVDILQEENLKLRKEVLLLKARTFRRL